MDDLTAGDSVYILGNIEALLAQDFVIQNLDSDGLARLSEMVADKREQKLQNTDVYGTSASTFYTVLDKTCEDSSIKSRLYNNSTVGIQATSTYVYTPKGSKVTVLIRGEELTSAQIAKNNAEVAQSYPDAIRLGSSTTNYNCHSYAWYKQSTSNKYWMNNPAAYYTDGSYTNHTVPVVNDKMTWTTSGSLTHSGVVISRLSGPVYLPYGYADLVVVKSKWGALGLYQHKGNVCPYWESGTVTKFYS